MFGTIYIKHDFNIAVRYLLFIGFYILPVVLTILTT